MTALLIAFLLHSTPDRYPDVVANVRKAITVAGSEPAWNETLLTGKSTYNGVDASYSLQFRTNGAFVQTIKGSLGQTFGSDGNSYWQIDRMGASRHLSFEDVDRTNALMMVLTDHWLDPTAHVNATLDRQGSKDGTFRIHIKPRETLLDEYITIDPNSWLPTKAEFDISSSKTIIELSDWKEAGAVRIPSVAKVTNEGLTDSFRVEEISEVHTIDPSIYSEKPQVRSDMMYDSTLGRTIETKRATTGHVLVHPRINGKDVGWFILDSGAESMVIDPKTADELQLPKVGMEAVVGVGGAVQEPFRTADKFDLGPASMQNVTFIEIDLAQLSEFFKVRISGIVGYDFFRRFIVNLDLKKPQVTVEDPTTYRLPSGTWSKLLFSTGNPAVLAKFEGDHQGWFRLDTGANGAVTFHTPTVESYHLLENRQTAAASEAGVGGTVEARIGHIDWFELGGRRFQKVEATFSQAKTGAFSDRYLSGNIGQDLMEPFVMVFDFGGSRVAFLPR